jgi:large conductance mechanosensitive channel
MNIHPIQSFVGEYKKFVNRGNVVDMAVGVIVGGAFTAIVTAMSESILQPVVNFTLSEWFGDAHLDGLYTMLKPGYTVDETGAEVLDLTQSIYIDWSTLINAIIHFLLVALVLFCVIRTINHIREEYEEFTEKVRKKRPSKEDRRAMRAAGVKLRNKAAVAAWYAEKAIKAEEARLAAEEQARLDRLANPTTEDLLKDIRSLLQRLAPEDEAKIE